MQYKVLGYTLSTMEFDGVVMAYEYPQLISGMGIFMRSLSPNDDYEIAKSLVETYHTNKLFSYLFGVKE